MGGPAISPSSIAASAEPCASSLTALANCCNDPRLQHAVLQRQPAHPLAHGGCSYNRNTRAGYDVPGAAVDSTTERPAPLSYSRPASADRPRRRYERAAPLWTPCPAAVLCLLRGI